MEDRYLEVLSKEGRMAIQLVFYDFILSKPMEYDPQKSSIGKRVTEVPIIRIFGATPYGQQVCLHVHGYLPYFYLPLPADIDKEAFLKRIHKTLERVAFKHAKSHKRSRKGSAVPKRSRRIRLSQSVSQSSSGSQPVGYILSQSIKKLNMLRSSRDKTKAYIHKIVVEEHLSFYGYNTRPIQFAKVYLYNPNIVKILAAYCIEVGIDKIKMQPYEVHVSYLIHFLADYNIKGLDFIFLSSPIKIRPPIPPEPKALKQPHAAYQFIVDMANDLPKQELEDLEQPIVCGSHSIFETRLVKDSVCELEIDTHCSSILNFYETNDYSDTQDTSNECSYECGQYMGGRDSFCEQWKKQCGQLNQLSISPLGSCNDVRPIFVSVDVRRRFYQFLLNKIRSMPHLDTELLSTCIKFLVQKWGDYELEETSPREKTTQEEFLTINSAWFAKDQRHTLKRNGGKSYYGYIYLPRLPDVEVKDVKEPTLYIGDVTRQATIPVDASKLSSLEQLINSATNFECGISIDVITEIGINKFHADPSRDAINAVVYTLRDHRLHSTFDRLGMPYFDVQGVIIVGEATCIYSSTFKSLPDGLKYALTMESDVSLRRVSQKIAIGAYTDIKFVGTELALFVEVERLFRTFDPNVIYGIDLQRNSIGYIHCRAQALGIPNFINLLSRLATDNRAIHALTDGTSLMTHQKRLSRLAKVDGLEQQKPIICIGRIMFDLYDLARYELNLANNSLENIVQHVFGYKMPTYSKHTINQWLKQKSGQLYRHRHRALSYMLFRLVQFAKNQLATRNYTIICVFDKLLYFKKYVTFSKLHGVDLKSAIVRGSQYLVGAVLSRFTKSCNYLLPSPTQKQVHEQRPSTAIPIVMHPISGLHLAPVAVLDFQSLYACITIAFNICYSTCLGVLMEHEASKSEIKLGVTQYKIEDNLFENIFSQLTENVWINNESVGVNIMPNQVMFVDKSIREGILPRMLRSILHGRIKIKTAMAKGVLKGCALYLLGTQDEEVMKKWDMEQYGLKMLANLTIGLSSSGYTGKMPFSDVSESIIATARSLIVYCIDLITQKFDAQVIYGDTDSLFIKFPGRTVEEAQLLSQEIANAINESIPKPIKIVPQKVYYPCILVSKKRYLGLYHCNGQVYYDDKGVETMRSSECDATKKVMRRALELVMENQSLDECFEYLLQVFENVDHFLTLKDFILYRRVKLGTYKGEFASAPYLLPPAAFVAKYRMQKHYGDRMNHNEWVPHVFAENLPGESDKINECAYFPNEIAGIFKPIDYIEELGTRTLGQNSRDAIALQIAHGKPLVSVNIPYYFTRHIIPPLRRIFQLFDVENSKIIDDFFWRLTKVANNHAQDHNRIATSTVKKINIQGTSALTNLVAPKCVCCNTPCAFNLTSYDATLSNLQVLDSTRFFYSLHGGNMELLDINDSYISYGNESSGQFSVNLCSKCRFNPKDTFLNITNEINMLQRRVYAIDQICLDCAGDAIYSASCQNAWHCQVYFQRIHVKHKLGTLIKRHQQVLHIAYTD